MHHLFQALCQCGRLKKRAGDERGLVENEGATRRDMTANVPVKFLFHLSNNMVSGDDCEERYTVVSY